MCQVSMNWWGPAWQHGCGTQAGCGPGGEGYWAGGAFGVRRPLRFLAFKLGLDERQVAELAQILNELKTERAQAAVDHRRTVAGFADALAGDPFDQAKADTAAELRLDSARKLRDAVVRALGRIHALLNPEQRSRLAYLIRTGTLIL